MSGVRSWRKAVVLVASVVVMALVIQALGLFVMALPLLLLVGTGTTDAGRVRAATRAPQPRTRPSAVRHPRVRPMPAQHVSQARSDLPLSTFADTPIQPLPPRSYVR